MSAFVSVGQASERLSPSYIQFAQSTNQALNDATNAIKQKTGGRILSSKIVKKNGHNSFKIKVLLPSGKVKVFNISAQ